MPDQPSPAAKKSKILYIEDNYMVSELYTRALNQAGYEVTLETDGDKGMDMAKGDEYDIILLDLMVPSKSGVDILKMIHDYRQFHPLHAKVIVTTDMEQRPQYRESTEKMADGYLIKAATTPRQLIDFLSQIKTAARSS